jgi:hypothetical protein
MNQEPGTGDRSSPSSGPPGAEAEQGEEQAPARPPTEPAADRGAGAALTGYRRYLWLLLVILGVVVIAWIAGKFARPGMQEPGAAVEIGTPAEEPQERPPPLTYEQQLMRQELSARQRSFELVGAPERLLLLAPPQERQAESGARLQPRVFDVTNRVEGFRFDALLRIPAYAGLPVLDTAREDSPVFAPATEIEFLEPSDLVIVVDIEGAPRAYPFQVLGPHGAIVDRSGPFQFLVSLSMDSHAATAFRLAQPEAETSWHKSGWLYGGNAVLFDAATGSLWDTLRGAAITGPRAGTQLKPLPAGFRVWEKWQAAHPEAPVLTMDTGHPEIKEKGGYGPQVVAEYSRYMGRPGLRFAVPGYDPSEQPALPPKAFVVGVRLGEQAKAYPVPGLLRSAQQGEGSVSDTIGEHTVTIVAGDLPATTVTDEEGRAVYSQLILWFAWKAAHPETELWLPAWTPPTGADDTATDTEVHDPAPAPIPGGPPETEAPPDDQGRMPG